MKPAHSPIHPHGSFVFEVIGRLFRLAEKLIAESVKSATAVKELKISLNLPDFQVPFSFSFVF